LRKGAVYSFEPALDAFDFLLENIAPYSASIRAFPFGLFSRDCEVPLFRGRMNSAASSLVRNDLTTEERAIVSMKRASDALSALDIERISILKIDTEGCELPILEELKDALSSTDVIFVEYHSESDRLAIDARLSPRFLLFHARATLVHRGVYGYVAKRLLPEVPELNEYEIHRPE
jgi:FkbM family methyltransferase